MFFLLKILTGGIASGKDKKMLEYICQEYKSGKDVLIIIPEQYVYEYDKRLYSYFGARTYNLLTVHSFSKLALTLIKKYGSSSGEYATDYVKQIACFLAIKKLKADKTAKYYQRQLDKSGFINSASELIKELRHGDIKPNVLSSASENINGALYDKLCDIDAIYSAYTEILNQNNKKDDLTMLIESVRLANDNNYFKDTTVFIDEFDGFTADQYEMIKVIISQASDVYVSLSIGYANNSTLKLSPFVNAIKTQTTLIEYANIYNKSVEVVKITDLYFKSDAVKYLSQNIFYPLAKKCCYQDGLSVICADDQYQEIEYIASEIKRLIVDCGYKYNEIAVVSRQLNDYFSIVSGLFERYEIPYFMDTKQSISHKAFTLHILSMLSCVITKSFKTENILKYIKSSLSGISIEEISNIEDFCYKWNVDGDMWLSDFDVHVSDKDNELIIAVNETRKKIITPLVEFKKRVKDTDAVTVCRSFYKLLEATSISQTITLNIKGNISEINNGNKSEIEIAREFKQLWGVLIKTIRAIYDNIGYNKLSLKDFYELLKYMLSNQTIATPPQKLDAVIVASAERSKLTAVRAVFVIGVNEGIMPYYVKDTGLFSDKDKLVLEKEGITFSKKMQYRLDEERAIVYRAFSSAYEKLYISYPLADAIGGKKRPSSVIHQISKMFDKNIFVNAYDVGAQFYCTTKKAAFSKFIENYRVNDTVTNSIRTVLEFDNEYKAKLDYIKRATVQKQYYLSKQTAKDMFFKNAFYISPTTLDSYNKCPFNYFCKQGLKLKPVQTVEINPVNRGNIVHYCLENIMSEYKNGTKCFNEHFLNMNCKDIELAVKDMLQKYKQDFLGGDFGKTARFEILMRNVGKIVYEVICNIQTELISSEFKPFKFELPLQSEKGENYYSLALDSGIKIILKGKIDRADLRQTDNNNYIRIVDYKTGVKQLSYSEMYFGISLQMILYLMAVVENDSSLFPAGALYMPAVMPSSNIVREYSPDAKIDLDISVLEDKKKKDLVKNGLIVRVADNDVMNDLTNKDYVYIKNRNKSDGDSDIISKESFDMLKQFAQNKLIEMAQRLQKGDINAVPTGEKDKLPCKYCDYWSVCGNYMTQNANIITNEHKEKLKEIISADNSEVADK